MPLPLMKNISPSTAPDDGSDPGEDPNAEDDTVSSDDMVTVQIPRDQYDSLVQMLGMLSDALQGASDGMPDMQPAGAGPGPGPGPQAPGGRPSDPMMAKRMAADAGAQLSMRH